ncbi:MAG: glycosyltransferase family 2 protein [Anaerolineae bacterium]
MPRISVIIPNWNGLEHLGTCLSALDRQTLDDFETIVVDNASSDGSVAFIRRESPHVKIIELPENRGFAGACNAGIRQARGEFLVLLNNDTEVDPHWLAAIVDAFERHPEAGIVASKMLLFDQRDIFHTAGDFYQVDGIPGNRGVWEQDRGQYDQEAYVFSACGGAAAYRRVMLDEIGLLDEDFFYSCEDVDLAWRAQLADWRAVYTPAAVVYHKLSATGGGTTASFYDGRNFLYLIAKDYPTTLLRKYWRNIVAAQLKIASDALKAWRGAAARARLCGMVAGLFNLPRMLAKRRLVQASRKVTDEYLESILTTKRN